jgi:hypothetical protein
MHDLFAEIQCENGSSLKYVILSDQRESKDLRTTDTAKILRFAALTQDDRLARLNLFAESPMCNRAVAFLRFVDLYE